jgi:violaxanthin de-epoxidase
VSEDAFPVPKEEVIDNTFDVSKFKGRWYITAGYNKLFDTFDCQEHYFDNPDPGKLFAKIQWRINKTGGDFLERSTVQRFIQVSADPFVFL